MTAPRFSREFIGRFVSAWNNSQTAPETAGTMKITKEEVASVARYLRARGYLLRAHHNVPEAEDIVPIPADRVCIYAPGSKEKIAELQRRASLGMHLHHQLDATPETAVNRVPLGKMIMPRSKTRFVY